MIDVDKYVPFLVKHKITQPQFLLLYCLYKKKYKAIELYKNAFPTDDGSMIGKYPLEDLIQRGFIEIVDDKAKASSYKITKKFTTIFIDKSEAAREFWEKYPADIVTSAGRLPLTLMDEDEFATLYHNKIDGNFEEHQEVLKDLVFAVENGLIKGTIKNFVSSRAWLNVRKERLATVAEEDGRKEF